MKLHFRLVIFTGISIALIISCTGQILPKRCGIKLKKVECIPNSQRVANVSCRVKAIDRCTGVVDFFAAPIKPLKYLDMHIKLWKRFSGWKPFLVEGDIRLCKYLGTQKNGILMKIFKKTISKYTNLNHSCPITYPVIFANMNADVLDFGKSLIPEGYYRLDLNISEGKKENHVGLISFYGDIDEPVEFT